MNELRPGTIALCQHGILGVVRTTLENGLTVGEACNGHHWQSRAPTVVIEPCRMCNGSGDRPSYEDEACRSCGGAGATLTPGAYQAILKACTRTSRGAS